MKNSKANKREFRSKTSQINFLREALLGLFNQYALIAKDWEPAAEGDYEDLIESVNTILEESI